MSLSAEAQHESFEALFSSYQQHAKQAGYMLIKQKLEIYYGRLVRYIACKGSGKSKSRNTDNDAPRQRIRSAHKTGIILSNLLVQTDIMIGMFDLAKNKRGC